jgi:hypothetical protein
MLSYETDLHYALRLAPPGFARLDSRGGCPHEQMVRTKKLAGKSARPTLAARLFYSRFQPLTSTDGFDAPNSLK